MASCHFQEDPDVDYLFFVHNDTGTGMAQTMVD